MANGFNQIVITNSDTPDHTDLFRYVSSEGILTAIRIAADLGEDAVFSDYHIISGVAYCYFARSFLSTGGYTDSDPTSPITNTLDGLWISEVTSDSQTSNAAQSLNLFITGARKQVSYQSTSRKFKGRPSPMTIFGQQTGLAFSYDVIVPRANLSQLDTLQSLFDANDTLCVRDPLGNRLFGRLNQIPFLDQINGDFFPLTFQQEDQTEAV